MRRGATPSAERRPARRPLLAALALTVVASATVVPSSLAQLTASSVIPNCTLSTRTWYFLHNNPTPPVGNTNAVANLSMDGVLVPTQATLYNYDSNADSLPGRRIQRSATGPGDTTLARYANWRTAAFTSARLLSGTVTLRIWSGITGFPLNQRGVLVVYLRDFNPATSAYTEIANATLDQANWQAGTADWVLKQIDISVASYTLAVGRVLEVKVVTNANASNNMVVAYDTTSYMSFLSIP